MNPAETEEDLNRILPALEERLLQPEVRRSPAAVAELLADDFLEFGSSGRVYDKATTLLSLDAEETAWRYEPSEFAVRPLAKGLALLTYRLRATSLVGEGQRCTLRSSLWRQDEDGWRMVFHQGTLTQC
jgi:hypothetical protein